MPSYDIIFRPKPSADVERQTLTAGSEAEARQRIEQTGGRVLAIVGKGAEGEESLFKKILFGRISIRFGVNTAELALLCEVLRALYSSGVPLLQAVQMTIDETPNPWLKRRLFVVLDGLKQGQDLYSAMSDPRCAKAFPLLMRETIRTGEANGRLDRSLERLAEIMKRAAETKRETISALIYPGMALLVFFTVCTVIAWILPPALEDAAGKDKDGKPKLESKMSELPFAIRTLFILRKHKELLAVPFVVIGAVSVGWTVGKRFPVTRLALTRVEHRIPVIGKILYQFSMVRFLDLLSANHETGIQVGESLNLIYRSVNDAVIEDAITRIRYKIMTAGCSLSLAMSDEKAFPGLAKQMIRAGEESGKLSDMLGPIIAFYTGQAKALLKRSLDLMTPVMIILLGSVIGPVVLGVYTTLFKMQEWQITEYGG